MSTLPVVGLLGPVTVRPPGGTGSAPARLDADVLAHLALARGRAVSTDELVDAVWWPEPPRGARNALQVKVSRLRRHLGPLSGALQHEQGAYRLDLPPELVDAHLVGHLAAAAGKQLEAGDLGDATATIRTALKLWRGPALVGLDEHPRFVAARERLAEQRLVLVELLADASLSSGADAVATITTLREVLTDHPLRPRARLLLMRALDSTGRRAEALAVFDAGRRLHAEQTGLTPPPDLQQEFDRLLADERRAARREHVTVRAPGVPAGALETARWLATDGAVGAARELALRGAWWWWLRGLRTAGRDLLEDLVGRPSADGEDGRAVLGATAWLAVFESVTADAETAIATGEAALGRAAELGWGRHGSVAAVLLAERLLQRGSPGRARVLLRASRANLAGLHDRWGLALVELVEARAALQRGWVTGAVAGARATQRAFEELEDPAGQMMALDLAGYCAEVGGDLTTAARTHERALALARSVDAPEWQAAQLTRLGSVGALLGDGRSITTLRAAGDLARSAGSPTGAALAENGLALAHGLLGMHEEAAEIHAGTLDWYEQQASLAGVSYTAGRLALERAATGSSGGAQLALRSVELARRTGDPRAVAHGLEALALTHDDASVRARALGGAGELRRRTRSPLPPVMAAPVRAVRRQVADQLGVELRPRLQEGAREASALLAPATS